MNEAVHIKSISDIHDYLGLPTPSHPLITVLPHVVFKDKIKNGTRYAFDLYQVSLKDGIECAMGYGRSTYDFKDGSMVFISPGQEALANNVKVEPDAIGWTIAFHPNLIKHSALRKKIKQYTFFEYEIDESLHLSEKEIEIVSGISAKIEYESTQNIDRHTQALLRSNLELLLDYCVRFYDRQFYIRSDLSKSYVGRFEALLNDYYISDRPLLMGIPTVQYCGQELGLSPYYMSDLLKQETGKSALELIHLFLVEKAQNLMSESELSITQISYELGFAYPQHFSKVFKSKVGMSPRKFRAS